jgi:hypothetical protein
MGVLLPGEWRRIVYEGKVTTDPSNNTAIWLNLITNGTDDLAGFECYIDSVSLIYSTDRWIHSHVLGATPQADETASLALSGFGANNWSIAFDWRPGQGYKELPNDFTIATVMGEGSTWAKLWWDASEKKITLTDNLANVIASAALAGWRHHDIIRLCLRSVAQKLSLSIFEPVGGTQHIAAGDVTCGKPTSVTFGADSGGTNIGLGLYYNITSNPTVAWSNAQLVGRWATA